MKINVKGFTLLELIVVVAIIGVLSVILLPSFRTALTKANDTKLKQFAINLDKKNDLTNIYDFEEGNGLVAKDSNIYTQNNMTIPGSGVTYSQNTYSSSSQYSLYFNGASHITAQNNSPANLDNKSFSVSFWFKMDSTANGCMVHKGNPGVVRQMLEFCYWLDSMYIGFGSGLYLSPNYKVTPLVWHHFAFSFDSSTNMTVAYVDGAKIGEYNLTAPLTNTSNFPLSIGSYANGSYPFAGNVDDFHIFEGQVIVR